MAPKATSAGFDASVGVAQKPCWGEWKEDFLLSLLSCPEDRRDDFSEPLGLPYLSLDGSALKNIAFRATLLYV